MPATDMVGGAFSVFPNDVQAAIVAAPLPSLGEGPSDDGLRQILNNRKQSEWLASVPPQCHREVLSGLWLLAGDLDRSHTISQDVPSATGSFLHGIMHRREGDFGNSKYWFRRVGSHPVLPQIAEHAGDIYADPFDFVDSCQHAVRSGDLLQQCQQAQWIEWQLLMQHILSG